MSLADGLNSGECGLSDDSSEGDWRLPTKSELQSIGTDPPEKWVSGEPSFTWSMPSNPFVSVQHFLYWSSTPYASNTDYAWWVFMLYGTTDYTFQGYGKYVLWPVRLSN
jgi:hypothetical protein